MVSPTRRQMVCGTAAFSTLVAAEAQTAGPSRFTTSGNDFRLDGQPFQILAGELHYPRIPRGSWRDRLRKLKALGLNTVSAYVFWNIHEVRPGVFDFTGSADVAAFIRMAQQEGLWVLLRPGPYVCAEWDGGGLPAWLFPTPDIPARTLDPRYMGPVRRWLKRLGQELSSLLIDRGGPILMTQVENEYGPFGADQAYMGAQVEALRQGGFTGLLYTADPAKHFAKGAMPGIVGGINFGTKQSAEKEFALRARTRMEGPYLCAELWGGWYDRFGMMHETMPIPPLIDSLQWMLGNQHSFSFYMLQGGTSFGFTAGANWDAKGFAAVASSYDYDALLDEAGRPTEKYRAVEALMRAHLPADRFGPMPEPEPSISIAPFRLSQRAPLSALLGTPVSADDPKTLEALGQTHGLMLYRHRCRKALKGQVRFGDLRDYAVVRTPNGGETILDRRFGDVTIDVDLKAGEWLDVLVDTMGHCHYGGNIGKDQKGLIGPVTFNDQPLTGWVHWGLPLDDLSRLKYQAAPISGPAFHRATFDLQATGFTFLDMRGWGKGYVWVNGHNLGRYWSAGPQGALFVPRDWLRVGENEVIVLDLHEGGDRRVSGGPQPIWQTAPKTEA